MQKNKVIATHNGAFHADDVFAVTVLQVLFPRAQLVRTRDAQAIAAADFAVDVGGAWEAAAGRFDHHQKGFDGRRANGVLYAAAGLVWSAFGKAFVQFLFPYLTEAQAIAVQGQVDELLVQHLDRADTGVAQGAPGYYGLSMLVDAFNTTATEERPVQASRKTEAARAAVSAEMKLQQFHDAQRMLRSVLVRVVTQVVDEMQAAELVRGAQRFHDGRVLVLPESGLSWTRVVCQELPDVLFVVYPDSTDRQYQVRVVPIEPDSFQARVDLPQQWAGLRDAAMAKVTGVPDAVFCHNGRFIAGAGSKEGALKLAELALADAVSLAS